MLTVFAAYLALTGQVRFGDPSQLRAAPQKEPEVSWKPAKDAWTTREAPSPAGSGLKIVPAADQPEFRPATLSGTVQSSATELGTEPREAPANPKVRAVMDSYLGEKNVVGTRHQEENPKLPPPINPGGAPAAVTPMPTSLPMTPAVQPPAPITLEEPRPRLNPLATGIQTKGPSEAKEPTTPMNNQPETIPTPPTPIKKSEPERRDPKRKYPVYEPRSPDDALVLAAARAAYQAGKNQEAIERFEAYLSRNMQDYDVHAEFAGILVTLREVRRAIREYEYYLAARPDDLTVRVILGDVYQIAREHRQAINQFTIVLEKKLAEEQTPETVRQVLELATRLARAYAFDSDFVRANQIFDRYLARLRPEDPRTPRALGSLLLDLERVSDAMPFLLRQRELHPEDIEILGSLVRALARLGERARAMEILLELGTRDAKNIGVREVLAQILYETEEFELAGQAYAQILAVDPTNGGALVGVAAVHNKMFNPNASRRVLDSFIPGKDVQRPYLITYAAYHETIGEYTEAKQIYKDMLRRDERDHEVRSNLAYLYDYNKEWEKAKAEYAKIIPPTATPSQVRKARLGFATVLSHQRKFPEALEVLRILLAEDPTDSSVVATMADVLTKSGAADKAEQLTRGYLASNPRSEYMGLTVRLALGKALLAAGKNLEAAREYEIALSRPIGRIPDAYHGLAKASERLGNAQRSSELIACVITGGGGGGTLRNQILLADLFSGDYEDYRVVEILSPVAGSDPNNLAILIRLADAQQRIARMTGQPADCFVTCQKILTLSPTNVRGHLAMARSFAIAQNYRKAAVQYDQLMMIDPEFMIPPRERARVLYADHQYSSARSSYRAMQSNPNPEQQLQADLVGLMSREPRLRAILGPYTAFDLPAKVLRAELPKVAVSLIGDPEAQHAIQRITNDYDARLADVTAFQGEEKAKEEKDVRPYAAVPAYEAINLYEPTNTETLFDAGQNYGRLKKTRQAIQLYSQTLQVDPTHREAMVASERATANISPRFDASFDYFYQRGRNGLTNIDRYRWTIAGAVSLGDEDEYFQVGYSRVLYAPTDDRTLNGDIPFLRVQKRFIDHRLLAYGQFNVENFPNRFQTRPTFDVGFRYQHTDCVATRFGGYLENVAENGESLRQDIFRGGIHAGADFSPTRYWNFGGTYRFGSYSDDNSLNQFDLFSELSLTLPPKQLKVALNYFFQGFAEQSIFPTNPPNSNFIRGTIHPYFAPQAFSYTEARLEWHHWLSRDYFVHSNQCKYSVQYGLGTDDSLNTYNVIRASALYEPCSWLSLGVEARGQFSSVYDNIAALAYLQLRFR